jgi:hypothetical protein
MCWLTRRANRLPGRDMMERDDPVVAVSRLTYWPFVGAADKLSRLMLQTVEREFVQLILGSSPSGPML